jgi:heterodisulfide reductase subunit A-like polyferredoxin
MKYRVEIREQAGSRERWTPACDETFADEGEAKEKARQLVRRALTRAARLGALRTLRFRVVPVALAVACGVLQ